MLLALPVWAVAAEAADNAPSNWDRFQGMLANVTGELLTLVGQVMGWSVGFSLLGLIIGVSGGFFVHGCEKRLTKEQCNDARIPNFKDVNKDKVIQHAYINAEDNYKFTNINL